MSVRTLGGSMVGSLSMVVAGAAILVADDSTETRELPLEYRLKAGQVLTYESYSEFNYGSGSTISAETMTFWVVRQNGDGSWRLIVRQSRESEHSEPRITIGWFDLSPTGRVVWNPSLGFQLDPTDVFVELPEVGTTSHDKWRTVNEVTDKTRLHQRQASSTADVVITVEQTTSLDAVYLSTAHFVVHFDSAHGIVRSVESTSTQGYGFEGKGNGLAELISVETLDEEAIPDYVEDLQAYQNADRKYKRLVEEALRAGDRLDELLEEAKGIWPATSDGFKTELFQTAAKTQASRFASVADWVRDRAELRAKLIGRPSPEWETVDLDGKSHSPAAHRGKVVVLDFWYRGCGWCIRGMPQMKRLAAAFVDDPVVVLGMNTDREDKDASFVIERMALNYPTLKAEGIPDQYQVSGFPTLIILDQHGRIHDLHTGYSPTLFDDVSASITGLLERQ